LATLGLSYFYLTIHPQFALLVLDPLVSGAKMMRELQLGAAGAWAKVL
jgi:hypothetical protein